MHYEVNIILPEGRIMYIKIAVIMNSVINTFVNEFVLHTSKTRERRRADAYDSISLESSFFSKMKIVGASLGLSEAQINVYTNNCKLVPSYYNLSARMFCIVMYYLSGPKLSSKKLFIPTTLADITEVTYADIEGILDTAGVKEADPNNRLIAFRQYLVYILVHVYKVPLM